MLGIVLVNASPDFFVERFRDIESYKKGTSVPVVKKLSDPPRIEDLDQLQIDKKDYRLVLVKIRQKFERRHVQTWSLLV